MHATLVHVVKSYFLMIFGCNVALNSGRNVQKAMLNSKGKSKNDA